jgi:hypothetical protein
MAVPFADGVSMETITSSREASLLGKYWNAVKRYKHTGDVSHLDRFRGKEITVRGRKVALLTDKDALDTLARSGEMDGDDVISETSPCSSFR